MSKQRKVGLNIMLVSATHLKIERSRTVLIQREGWQKYDLLFVTFHDNKERNKTSTLSKKEL